MKRTTWLTEERTVAPAVGAPGKAGFVPAAFGPGLVRGNATSILRTARHGMPLRSPGAGVG